MIVGAHIDIAKGLYKLSKFLYVTAIMLLILLVTPFGYNCLDFEDRDMYIVCCGDIFDGAGRTDKYCGFGCCFIIGDNYYFYRWDKA